MFFFWFGIGIWGCIHTAGGGIVFFLSKKGMELCTAGESTIG